MESWIAKLICLVILLLISVVFGFVPRLISTRGNERYLSIANCLAGGVLMGTTLLHLLPEVMEDVGQGLKMIGVDTDYPIATLTVGIGFLIIVFIEMLAHTIQDKLIKDQRAAPTEEELNQEFMEDEINLFDSMERVRRFTRASSRTSVTSSQDGTNTRGRTKSWRVRTPNKDPEQQALLNNTVQNSRKVTYVSVDEGEQASSGGHAHGGHAHEAHGGGHGQGHAHDHGTPTEIKGFGSVLLLFALSVHAILEGMAVGSERDWLMVFTLTGALSAHKLLLAFALGVKIVEENQTLTTHIRAVALFATSTPVGVAIGVAIQLGTIHPATKKLVEGLIQAAATGTFIYIAFVEIVAPELNKPDLPPLLKVLFLSVGYGIMCCAQLLPEGEDDIDPVNGTMTTPLFT